MQILREEPPFHYVPVGKLAMLKRPQERYGFSGPADEDEYFGAFPKKLLSKGEELIGREVNLLLPGFSYSEAQAVVQRWRSAIWGSRRTMTHEGDFLSRKLPELEQMLDSVVADSNWVLQKAYVQNIPHAVKWHRIEGDRYELRAYNPGFSKNSEKRALVRKAKLAGRVIRFLYPDRSGMLRTRRVAVRKLSASEIYDHTFGTVENALYRKAGKREPYFSAVVRELDDIEFSFTKSLRRFTLAKASDMVIETASAKTLQPEWCITVKFEKDSCRVKLSALS